MDPVIDLAPPDMEQFPWEHLPDEPAIRFQAFNDYLLMGARRSINGLSVKFREASENGDTVPCVSVSALRHWRNEHDWVERARAYDDALQQQRRVESEAYLLEVRQHARELQIETLPQLSTLLQDMVKNTTSIETESAVEAGVIVRTKKSRPYDIVAVVQALTNFEAYIRLLAGEPNEIADPNATLKIKVEYADYNPKLGPPKTT